jgi:hypothetical protein
MFGDLLCPLGLAGIMVSQLLTACLSLLLVSKGRVAGRKNTSLISGSQLLTFFYLSHTQLKRKSKL